MTKITVFQDADGNYTGFEVSGHAMFVDKGNDIVCAAVSMLAINTVNAIETFVLKEGQFTEIADPEDGLIRFEMKQTNHDTQLLVDAMLLGLREMEKQHPENIRLIAREV